MEGMFSYTQAAMERTMKVQEVILRALAKKITWWQAAEIIGISDRQMRRWHERYEEFGFRGLFDRRRGKPSPKKVPLAVVEKVLGLYREKYFDLNVRHFHEKLQEEHQVEISYSWVKGLLQGAGMVAKGRKRGVHRKLRPRRPLPGMLLHIDGSEHRWFQDERWYDLLVIMDDANSAIYYAQLVEEEATVPVLAGLKEVVERKGVFCALYSDRARHFWLTAKAGEAVDHDRLTQVGRALRELGVRMIPAYSPQARGRSERSFATWQGGLPQELRLRGIRTVEAPNAFLRKHCVAQSRALSRLTAMTVSILITPFIRRFGRNYEGFILWYRVMSRVTELSFIVSSQTIRNRSTSSFAATNTNCSAWFRPEFIYSVPAKIIIRFSCSARTSSGVTFFRVCSTGRKSRFPSASSAFFCHSRLA